MCARAHEAIADRCSLLVREINILAPLLDCGNVQVDEGQRWDDQFPFLQTFSGIFQYLLAYPNTANADNLENAQNFLWISGKNVVVDFRIKIWSVIMKMQRNGIL